MGPGWAGSGSPGPSLRDEIAGCIEKAYEKILFTEATRILFFNTPKKMTDYAKKVLGHGARGHRVRQGGVAWKGTGTKVPSFSVHLCPLRPSCESSVSFCARETLHSLCTWVCCLASLLAPRDTHTWHVVVLVQVAGAELRTG